MPKSLKGWLMFGAAVIVVIAVARRVPQLQGFV